MARILGLVDVVGAEEVIRLAADVGDLHDRLLQDLVLVAERPGVGDRRLERVVHHASCCWPTTWRAASGSCSGEKLGCSAVTTGATLAARPPPWPKAVSIAAGGDAGDALEDGGREHERVDPVEGHAVVAAQRRSCRSPGVPGHADRRARRCSGRCRRASPSPTTARSGRLARRHALAGRADAGCRGCSAPASSPSAGPVDRDVRPDLQVSCTKKSTSGNFASKSNSEPAGAYSVPVETNPCVDAADAAQQDS